MLLLITTLLTANAADWSHHDCDWDHCENHHDDDDDSSSGDCDTDSDSDSDSDSDADSDSDTDTSSTGDTGETQVTLCHVPPGNPSQAHTITVGASAVDTHLEHHQGDHLGECTCEDTLTCDTGSSDTSHTGDTGERDTSVETDTDTDSDSDSDTHTDADSDTAYLETADTGDTDTGCYTSCPSDSGTTTEFESGDTGNTVEDTGTNNTDTTDDNPNTDSEWLNGGGCSCTIPSTQGTFNAFLAMLISTGIAALRRR